MGRGAGSPVRAASCKHRKGGGGSEGLGRLSPSTDHKTAKGENEIKRPAAITAIIRRASFEELVTCRAMSYKRALGGTRVALDLPKHVNTNASHKISRRTVRGDLRAPEGGPKASCC